MRRLVQELAAVVALMIAVPANAATWYATFWGDGQAVFEIDDYFDPNLNDTPNLFYSEAVGLATFPENTVPPTDIGRMVISTIPGLNSFYVLSRDNEHGWEGLGEFSTSTNIFTPDSPFDHEIDYRFVDGDSRSAAWYPNSIYGPSSTPLTGIYRFTLSQFAPAVPEASTWLLLIVGFGAAGVALRRRRSLMLAGLPSS